jgi:hypothetical protein
VNVPEDGFAVFTNVSPMAKPRSVAQAARTVVTDGPQESRHTVALDPATP